MVDTLGTLPEGMEGAGWAVSWRVLCHRCEGNPVPLPIPKAKQFFATFREMFKASVRSQQQQQAPFHRCVCECVCVCVVCVCVHACVGGCCGRRGEGAVKEGWMKDSTVRSVGRATSDGEDCIEGNESRQCMKMWCVRMSKGRRKWVCHSMCVTVGVSQWVCQNCGLR